MPRQEQYGSRAILVVEDDADIRTLIREALTLAEYAVDEAQGGEEALRKIKKRKYDLVLLDIMMPNRDGYQVLETIKSMPDRKDVPVIAVTAKGDPQGLVREAELGAVDHLAKPFNVQALHAAVEHALGATPEQLQEHRVMRERAADVYQSVVELSKARTDER
jgi:DNA-binding response OmpR family regulator